ncbi:MAG TPA: tetratricopeptide repeat-containing sensor histidine kinase, partial [Tenuifilaceae bacterium]|nr:tetratricopeptide repeat-containing sensor histidine kinase [Tenuifilaceae bacterium]
MKRTIKYLPILFSALWISASAQVNSRNAVIDSLTTIANSNKGIIRVTAYDKISRLYWQTNPDSSIYYASLALSEAEKDKSDACYGEAYNSLGNAYSSKGEFEQSIEFYTKSMEHRERSNDMLKVSYSLSNLSFSLQNLKRYSEAMDALKRAASICNSIGNAQDEALINQQIASLYKNLQDLNRALEYALKAVNINLSNNITTGLANNYNFIGLLHKDLKNFDLAEEYFLKSLKIWQQEKNEEGLSNTYNNLGIVYDEKKDAQKALEYYSKSLELSKKLGDLKGIAVAYNNIGFLSIRINQIDAGIDSYLKSIKISHDLNDIESYLNTYNNIAIAYLKKNNIEKSEEYVNLVLKEFDKVNDLAIIQETYKILSDINSKKGNFKKAFEYKTIELAYNDTLYTQQQTSNIIEMQTRFETEAKEREIQILKKDNDIKQLEFERQRFFQRILIIISILFLIILVGGAMSFRYIRRSNKLLEQKNIEFENANIKLIESEKNLRELNATKDKLFSIIAHDLKNPFNALMGFSDLLDKNYNFLSEEERKEYIGVVSDSTQNLYKLLDNLLQWTRTQTGAITYISENFKLYPLIKQEVDILSPNADKKKININLKLDENQIVYADKNSIATVVRNLVSNAIKFTSNGGWIEIDAKQNSKFVEISVSDSGIGIKGDDIDKIFMPDSFAVPFVVKELSSIN